MSEKKIICGLGELLWDLLPGGEQLGGAPANFAVMAGRLGNHAVVASRLGEDERGARARALLSASGIDLAYLQADPLVTTGTAGVEVNDGEPGFAIHQPAAWDFLEWTPQWATLAAATDAVCFGTLAQRHPQARATLQQFISATRDACVRVFDVNLRPPFYSAEIITASLAQATIFKLNESEVPRVLAMLDAPPEADLVRAARWFLSRFPLSVVAITLGSAGSLLVTRDAADRHPGVQAKIADTIGAGDAFTAALVDACLRGATLAAMNEAGNRWGAWVASRAGAMPPLDADAPALRP